jgi:hypothetical protein
LTLVVDALLAEFARKNGADLLCRTGSIMLSWAQSIG